jgi:DNA recombination protein RmuC
MNQLLSDTLVLSVVISFCCGILLTYLISKLIFLKKSNQEAIATAGLRQSVTDQEALISELKEELNSAEAEQRNFQLKITELSSEIARFEERVAQQEEAKLALQSVGERFQNAFKALSSEALQSNNQAFLTLAQTAMTSVTQSAKNDFEVTTKNIAELVTPVKEALGKIDSRLTQVEQDRLKSFATLDEQIKTLALSNATLKQEASNLSKALKAPSVRGRWGEMQLKRVVELAGMSEHCDFCEQAQTSGDDDKKGRPDLIVYLPSGGTLAIDAKAPINSYLEALEVTEDYLKEKKLKDHAAHVRGHLQTLSRKGYWSQLPHSPDFTVLFIPGEVFFSAALEQDPSLLEYGMDQKVIIATPTTLLAMLKAVSYGWRQEKLSENAKQISKLASVLYERIGKFMEHFADLKTHLERSVGSFNKSVATLETRVIPSTNKLRELGASADVEIAPPESISESPRSINTNVN